MLKIWAWGANTNGQLGLPFSCDQVETPQRVNLPPNITASGSLVPLKISGGPYETLVLVEGPLEDESFSDVVQVTPAFKVLRSPDVQDVACGWEFSLGVKNCGTLELFGTNGGRNVVNKYFQVDNTLPGNPEVSQISAGMRHAVGILKDQTKNRHLLVCGDNSKGQLGLPDKTKKALKPQVIKVPGETSTLNIIRCGKEFSLVLDSTGDLYGAGSNKFGVLLKPPQESKSLEEFTRIGGRSDFPGEIKDIQCGWSHVVILLQDGRVYSWGRGDLGQLGRSGHTGPSSPCLGEVTFPERRITSIACGTEHSLALGESGKVYAWGWNEHANCGVGGEPSTVHSNGKDDRTFDNILYPTQVSFPHGDSCKISVIGAGPGSSFAVGL